MVASGETDTAPVSRDRPCSAAGAGSVPRPARGQHCAERLAPPIVGHHIQPIILRRADDLAALQVAGKADLLQRDHLRCAGLRRGLDRRDGVEVRIRRAAGGQHRSDSARWPARAARAFIRRRPAGRPLISASGWRASRSASDADRAGRVIGLHQQPIEIAVELGIVAIARCSDSTSLLASVIVFCSPAARSGSCFIAGASRRRGSAPCPARRPIIASSESAPV